VKTHIELSAPVIACFAYKEEEIAKLATESLHVLSEVEINKSLDFLSRRDSESYVAAHTLKRLLLAHIFKKLEYAPDNTRSEEFMFGTTIYGKPVLINQPLQINFSISHTRGGVAAAAILTDQGLCGIDIEKNFATSIGPELEKEIFTPNEVEMIKEMTELEKTFIQTLNWTRKEALLKLTGLGLSLPMRSIGFTMNGNQEPSNKLPEWVAKNSITIESKKIGDYHLSIAIGMSKAALAKDVISQTEEQTNRCETLMPPTQIAIISVDELIKSSRFNNDAILHDKNFVS
jgi:phosphopantetheinyl transferase